MNDYTDEAAAERVVENAECAVQVEIIPAEFTHAWAADVLRKSLIRNIASALKDAREKAIREAADVAETHELDWTSRSYAAQRACMGVAAAILDLLARPDEKEKA